MRWVSGWHGILLGLGFAFLPLVPGSVAAEVLTAQALLWGTPHEGPAVDGSSGPTITFFDHEGRLFFWDLEREGSKPLPVSLQALPEVQNSFNGFLREGSRLYFVWRPKGARPKEGSGMDTGDKHVLFRASEDGGKTFGPIHRLNKENGAFHPQIASGGNGALYVVWFDERHSGFYDVYLNRSSDFGKTWLKADVRLNEETGSSIREPFVLADGDRAWVGWLQAKEKGPALKLRHTEDGGETWSDELELPLPSAPSLQIYSPRLMKTGSGLVMLYYVLDYGVVATRSTDGGAEWGEPLALPGTKDVGSNGFVTAQNQRGDLCLVWPGPYRQEGKKADIFAVCSHDGGQTWKEEAKRLDTNTPRLTHSLVPSIAMDEAGRVVVVWMDSRNIRSNIYLNYSLDGGKTWLGQDIRVDLIAGGRFAQFPRVATDNKGRFLFAWQSAPADEQHKPVLAYEEIVFEKDGPRWASRPGRPALQADSLTSNPDPREALLLRRVEAFWKAYQEGRFSDGYEMMDPFYRAQIAKEYFLSRVGQIQYRQAEILKDQITITENFAKVSVKVQFEAPLLQVQKHMGSIPLTEREWTEDWIWLDGNWHKVYKDPGDNTFLPLY